MAEAEPLRDSPLRKTPWIGIVSGFAMLICAVVAAVVVAASHDDAVDSWEVQPAVLLAIISAVSNVAFGSALATGVAVRFWLYASRGATPSQLHYIWDHGRGLGFISAFRSGREARTVAILATLAYISQFASGPFLQRSTRQVIESRESPQMLSMDLSTHIPEGWLGTIEDGHSIGFRKGIPQVQQNFRNDTIRTREEEGYVCDGTCYGVVRGAGVAHRCTTRYTQLEMARTDNNGATVFAINVTRITNSTGQPEFRMLVLHVNSVNDNCVSNITINECQIDSAVVEYPVVVQNSTVYLEVEKLTSMHVLSTFWTPNDLPSAPNGTGAGLLSALDAMIDGNWATNTTKLFKAESIPQKTVYGGDGGTLADIFARPDGPAWTEGSPTYKCAITWDSPTEYVLREVHKFVFRSALRIGNGTERQTFPTRRVVVVTVFKTDGRYLGAATATMLCSLAFVASLMRGWWQLARPVTLSPLETAGAVLRAPVLGQEIVAQDRPLKKILRNLKVVEVGLGRKASASTPPEGDSGAGGYRDEKAVRAAPMVIATEQLDPDTGEDGGKTATHVVTTRQSPSS